MAEPFVLSSFVQTIPRAPLELNITCPRCCTRVHCLGLTSLWPRILVNTLFWFHQFNAMSLCIDDSLTYVRYN